MNRNSAGARFRAAMGEESPLQIVGTINAYTALSARDSGFRAIYLSGAGVANASLGVPDLGITTLNDVLEDARRITAAVELPLLVDIDTGWGGVLNIERTVRAMIGAGVAAVHIEDQPTEKRCGHRPGKTVVPVEKMRDRIKAAVGAKTDAAFVVMARTDALAVEGLGAATDRAAAYVEAGADMIFAEGVTAIEQYRAFVEATDVPVLANITEFGVTPLWTVEALRAVGVGMVLYPLSAFRAMSAAALKVYQTLRRDGTQKSLLDAMQTRAALYQTLDYHRYEEKTHE